MEKRQHIENVVSDDVLEKYLKWRFTFNNRNNYHHYYDEWRENILPDQISYFKEEMQRLIKSGKYKV